MRQHPHLAYRKDRCEGCGWKPPVIDLLQVDHRNRMHHQNNPANLRTLCPSCRVIKTWIERNPERAALVGWYLDENFEPYAYTP